MMFRLRGEKLTVAGGWKKRLSPMIPVVVLVEANQGVKVKPLVVMDMEQFTSWFGD